MLIKFVDDLALKIVPIPLPFFGVTESVQWQGDSLL